MQGSALMHQLGHSLPAQVAGTRTARKSAAPRVFSKAATIQRVEAVPANQDAAQAPESKPASAPLINLSGVTRRNVLQGALATVGLASCPCCAEVANAAEWDYENGGPIMWEGVCATGQRQSPVNIPVATATTSDPGRYTCKFGPIQFKYGTQERVVVLNTGHGTMQVNFKPGNIATIGGVDLELLQYHFHTPSEHSIDGKRAPMEVHLVHKVVSTGGLAVVGVMMEAGGTIPNPAVQTAYTFAPSGAKEMMQASRPVDPATLLPAEDGTGHRPYIHYAGSLTTPPCSEGVDWFVLTQPIRVTDKQILDFMHFVGNGITYSQNSRPVQPVGERKFKYEL